MTPPPSHWRSGYSRAGAAKQPADDSRQARRAGVYTGIQALRFVAASLVVASHAVAMVIDRHLTTSLHRWPNGHCGVDIFFAISGFVMLTSCDSLAGRARAWLTFLIHRIVRIVPMYWTATTLKIVLLLLAPAIASSAAFDRWHVLGSYLFLPALFPPGIGVPVLPVGWTLNFEMYFYAICAVALLARFEPLIVALVTLSATVAWGFFYPTGAPAETTYTNPIVLEFLLGMVAARLASRAPILGTGGLGVIAIACAVVLLATNGEDTHWRALVWGCPAALLVLCTAWGERSLRHHITRWMLLLGDSSYSLYLFHTFVVPATGIACASWAAASPWPVIGLSFSLSILIALIIHTRIERPVTNWLRNWPPLADRARRDGSR